ncbi:negative regulator of genetic competence ClpC/MecB, partial [Rhizophagus irregularis]
GRKVDFRNTVVIMTSNVGAEALKYRKNLGFGVGDNSDKYKDMKGTMLEELKKAFRPEFLNRIDEMIVFHSLEKDELKEIISLMATSLTKRLKEQDIELELTDAALEKIAQEGYDPQYGARPLRRSLQKHVEDRLSEELLKGNVSKGQQVIFDYVDGEFVIRQKDIVNAI